MNPTQEARSSTDIIGHPGALSLLDRSREAGRLAHAYIFVGPRHVGKMTLALHLAKAVNCQGEGRRPCDRCSQCRRIGSGWHADVQVIDTSEGESEGDKTRIGIDKVRGLQRQASLRPYEGACRVFILDGAELLTHEAANSLLKSLEEPPQGVLFVLLATDETSVLPTILSRCQRVELSPMSTDDLAQTLTSRYSVQEENARLIARLSGGCPGWAIFAAQDDSVLGARIDSLDGLIELADTDLEGRFQFASKIFLLYSNDRQAARDLMALWLLWWRDLLLTGADQGDVATNLHRKDKLEEQSLLYSLDAIQVFIKRIKEARDYLERNVNPRTALEWLMLRFPEAQTAGS
ncbi:MAG: DNA polymerase III subunit delta' [Dehalococcoidia bacterium]